ncbi:MAG: nuclear transport factor 2 family protein [Gemmatimonadota bacterium]|nr:MAG: nuclear transport factor 2 family protein [Gemmatimonadota bacterium]
MEDIRDLTQTIFDTFNNRDVSDLEQCLAEDAVFDFPGTEVLQGPKRILLFFKILFRKYPRLAFTVEDILVDEDRACAVWSNDGEDNKGNPYHNQGVTLIRVKDGKIVSISDYFKDTSFVETG